MEVTPPQDRNTFPEGTVAADSRMLRTNVNIAITATTRLDFFDVFVKHLEQHSIARFSFSKDDENTLKYCGNVILLDEIHGHPTVWSGLPETVINLSTTPEMPDELITDYNLEFHIMPEAISSDSVFDRRKDMITSMVKSGLLRYRAKPKSWEHFVESVRNIVLYSTLWNRLGLRMNTDDFSFQLLNAEDYGVSVIDDRRNIIYANARRRERHGNDILGQKCYTVFSEEKEDKAGICDDCPCDGLLAGTGQTKRCEIHRLKDKRDRLYYVSETASALTVNDTKLAVNVVRDITFRAIASKKSTEIQRASSADKIENIAFGAFKEMGFTRIRYYESNFDIAKPLGVAEPYNFLVGRRSIGMSGASTAIGNDSEFEGYRVYMRDWHAMSKVAVSDGIRINSKEAVEKQGAWLEDLGLLGRESVNLPLFAGDIMVGLFGLDCNGQSLTDPRSRTFVGEEHLLVLKEFSNLLAQAISSAHTHRSIETLSKMANKVSEIRQVVDPLYPLLRMIWPACLSKPATGL
jgi:hypothetical protein